MSEAGSVFPAGEVYAVEDTYVYNRNGVFSWRDLPEDLIRRMFALGQDEADFFGTSRRVYMAARSRLEEESTNPGSSPLCREPSNSACRACIGTSTGFPECSMSINISCGHAMVRDTPTNSGRKAPAALQRLWGKREYKGVRIFDVGCYRQMGAMVTRTIELMVDEVTQLEASDNQ